MTAIPGAIQTNDYKKIERERERKLNEIEEEHSEAVFLQWNVTYTILSMMKNSTFSEIKEVRK